MAVLAAFLRGPGGNLRRDRPGSLAGFADQRKQQQQSGDRSGRTPHTVFMSLFVHVNLNWTLGPLRYVIVSPVLHRWHHTGVAQGGSKNFGSNSAFFDLLFGTFYMPENKLPEDYGVDDPQFPQTFAGQTIHPFRERTAALATSQAPRLQTGGSG